MKSETKLPFFTLLLMISFASVNAVLFTPALPNIAQDFSISIHSAQQTITWFLIGFALTQLIYGPLANRYGRKPTLLLGVSLQIMSSFLCAISGAVEQYWLLILARFLLAIGSGVGIKMTFTLINECYGQKMASQKISYLMLGLSVTPGLSITLGGFLTAHFGWPSCFYAGAVYGLILFFLSLGLPETQKKLNYHALEIKHLIYGYKNQFNNVRLMAGSLLISCATAFIYVFSTAAPFIAINLFGMTSSEYGVVSLLPVIGLASGSLYSALLAKKTALSSLVRRGVLIASSGATLMGIALFMQLPPLLVLFVPVIFIYFGASLIIANASTIAMAQTHDKALGSAVMNFTSMSFVTLCLLSLGLFILDETTLIIVYTILCSVMIVIDKCMPKEDVRDLSTSSKQ